MIGRVVSTKMTKTVSVLVESTKTHPLYKKRYLRSKKYLVDDPMGVKLGQIVEFEKVRPISKMKHWQIKKVMGVDIVALGTQILKEEAQEAIAEVMLEVKEEAKEESRVESLESSEKEAETKKVSKEKKVSEGAGTSETKVVKETEDGPKKRGVKKS